jgi:hypothetical protein
MSFCERKGYPASFECGKIAGSSPDRVNPMTIELVFVASLLNRQHEGKIAKTCCHGIMIMCPSEATCLFADCNFSELAQ